MGWLQKLTGLRVKRLQPGRTQVVRIEDLPPSASHFDSAPRFRLQFNDGEKFPGGFGVTQLLFPDYWTLRARSKQLFETNLYARGLIRRLVTNEINTGLHLEATPEEALLGLEVDKLEDWSEDVENRFRLWGKDARQCDQRQLDSFAGLQASVRREAMVSGDVLVVLMQDRRTLQTRVKLIDANSVQSPVGPNAQGSDREIRHGVELDEDGRHVAFWIRKEGQRFGETTFSRLPAFGPRSGRRQAWLVYGSDKRHDEVRGQPLLGLVLQSLNEIDKYRDSAQRKAVLNSIVAMFIKKTEDKPSTLPMSGGAIRRGTSVTLDSNNEPRRFNIAEFNPGMIMEELQQGETPEGFMPHGTDEKFGDFEAAVIQAVAWCNEIPPEILRLSFNNNYAASQAAINEFKLYLNRIRQDFGENFCQPIYEDWLISSVLNGEIQAPGFLEAWRDPLQHIVFGSWLSGDWTGQIKLAVDFSKLVNGYKAAVEEGFVTRDRATRELTGTKYKKNVKKLKRENLALAEANEPLGLGTGEPAPTGPVPVEDDDDDDGEKGNEGAA